MVTKYALIVAGGSGSRMGADVPKQFMLLGGVPVLMHTLKKFEATCDQLILVLPQTQIAYWQNLCIIHSFQVPHQVVAGGNERFFSVLNGLNAITGSDGLVSVHDGVRPCVTPDLIRAGFEQADRFGSAVAAVKPKDSLRLSTSNGSMAVDRSAYYLVQTPQTFAVSVLKRAYTQPYQATFTDDASVVESAGYSIHLVQGDYKNLKITTPEDLPLAELFV